jgi:hypothetical protein
VRLQSRKKKITKKRDGGVVESVGPEFKSQYCKKKEKGNTNPSAF